MTYPERLDKMHLYLDGNYCTFPTLKHRAKLSIAAQAEAIIIREWGSLEKYNDWLKAGNPAALNTQKYLLENGYIEPKTDQDVI